MATKIFCDGCDRDITDRNKPGTRHGLRATFDSRDGNIVLGQFAVGPFDMCGSCIETLKRSADPKQWVRKEDRPTSLQPKVA